jgi:acyl carrier protein
MAAIAMGRRLGAFQMLPNRLGAAAIRTTADGPSMTARAFDAEHSLRQSLAEALGIVDERVAGFDDETLLFGALPELDSMAVATLLTDLEDRLGIVIDDDDIDSETFETFGSLRAFLARKLGAANA